MTTSAHNNVTLGMLSSTMELSQSPENGIHHHQNEDDDDDDDVDMAASSITPDAGVHFHPSTATDPGPRPTRESVLQRLSEALLRRSLTKVRASSCLLCWLPSALDHSYRFSRLSPVWL